MARKILRKGSLAASTILFVSSVMPTTPVFAQATVTGTAGCVVTPGQSISQDGSGNNGAGDTIPIDTLTCSTAYPDGANVRNNQNGTTYYGAYGNYVTADEVNAALAQVYTDLGGTGYVYDPTKDNEQDARLSTHDAQIATINTNINNINNVNNTQTNQLNDHEARITQNETDIDNIYNITDDLGDRVTQNETDIDNLTTITDDHEERITQNESDIEDLYSITDDHEERITQNESDIADINDGAVFYNRDEDGNKTGGVTFNDGTGDEVLLSNVAAGQTGTDAVNVDQLTAALDGLGGGAVVNSDGTVTGPTYNVGGADYDNVADALTATNNLSVQYIPDENGNPTNTVLLTGNGSGAPVTITNLANGINSSDAVNVEQLTASLDGLGGGATVNDDGTVTGPTYNVGGANYYNVSDALTATNNLSVQYVPDENGQPTNTVQLTGDNSGAPVTITNLADGVNDADAVNYGQVKDNVSYDRNADGTRNNTITLVGGNDGPVTIRNVADGVNNSDAANVGQVRTAQQASMDYTDQEVTALRSYSNARFEALTGELTEAKTEARAGIASAMAAAGLRFDDRPGKGSIAGSMGGFKGMTSMAVGVGYTSEDGRWRLNSAVSHSLSTNDTGWNAGASFTFN